MVMLNLQLVPDIAVSILGIAIVLLTMFGRQLGYHRLPKIQAHGLSSSTYDCSGGKPLEQPAGLYLLIG